MMGAEGRPGDIKHGDSGRQQGVERAPGGRPEGWSSQSSMAYAAPSKPCVGLGVISHQVLFLE